MNYRFFRFHRLWLTVTLLCSVFTAAAQLPIVGNSPNNEDGDPLGVALGKINANLNTLLARPNEGGTTNLAGKTSNGLVTSNTFAHAELGFGGKAKKQYPLRYLGSYFLNLNSPTLVSNAVQEAMQNGMFQCGVEGIDILGNGTNFGGDWPFKLARDAGGNLQWSDTWAGATTNLFPWLRSLGWKIMGYSECGGAAVPYPNFLGYETKDAAFFAPWTDFMQLDYGSGNNLVSYQTFVREYQRLHTQGPASIRILASGPEFPSFNISPQIAEMANSVGTADDFRYTGFTAWSQTLSNLDLCYNRAGWVGTARPDINNIVFTFGFSADRFGSDDAITNDIAAVRGLFAMACQIGCYTPIHMWNYSHAVAGRLSGVLSNMLTNPYLYEIQKDEGRCQKVFTSGGYNGYEGYVKKFDGDSFKTSLALFNRSSNTPAIFTVNFTNYMVPDGTWTVTEAHGRTNFSASSSFTWTVNPMDCAVFVVNTDPNPPTGTVATAQTNDTRLQNLSMLSALQSTFTNSLVWVVPMNGDINSRIKYSVGTNGNASVWTDGIFGASLDCRGTYNNGLTYPLFNIPTNSITFGCWLKTTNNGAGINSEFPMVSGPFAGNAGGIKMKIYPFGGYMLFDASVCTNASIAGLSRIESTTTNFCDGTWHFLLCSYDGDKTRGWVDGNNFSTDVVKVTGPLFNSSSPYVYIANAFKGQIAYPMIFNTALTTNQVNQLYNLFVNP